LDDLEVGCLGGLGQGGFLRIGKVGWDGDDGSSDLLSEIVGS